MSCELYDTEKIKFKDGIMIMEGGIQFDLEQPPNFKDTNLVKFIEKSFKGNRPYGEGFVKDSNNPACYTEQLFKKFTEKTGVTPMKAKKIYSVAYNKFNFEDDKAIYLKYAYYGNNVKLGSFELNKTVRQRMHHIKQCRLDNIEHIAPICLILNSNPSECRKILGKGLWKTLCKNSFTRNLNIFKNVFEYFETLDGIDCLDDSQNKRITKLIKYLNELKSKHLKKKAISKSVINGGRQTADRSERIEWVIRELNKKPEIKAYNFGYVVNKMHTLYDDTKTMCAENNRAFNPEWNEAEMTRIHDEFGDLRRRNAIGLADGRRVQIAVSVEQMKFELNHPAEIQRFEHEGYTATLLNNMDDLVKESDAMTHCIGWSNNYAKRMVNGTYVAYTIHDSDNKKVATLGITSEHSNLGVWRRDQLSGFRNAIIEIDEVHSLVKIIIDRVNKCLELKI